MALTFLILCKKTGVRPSEMLDHAQNMLNGYLNDAPEARAVGLYIENQLNFKESARK